MARRSCRGTAHALSSMLLLCAAAALLTTAFAADCNSAILQMNALPQDYDACFASPLTSNSIKAACTWGLRVRVKNGIVKIVPLVQASYNYAQVGPSTDTRTFLNCKDVNASGFFYPGSTTSASVMLYDDYGSTLSNLTKTGPTQITLTPAHTYAYKQQNPECRFNYTVVEGCLFGIKGAAKPTASCPAGYTPTKGRFSIPYCTPCKPGTYYNKATASCKPCAIGTHSPIFGATKCKKCEAKDGLYASKTGLADCEYCSSYDRKYTDGKSCKACPKGSYPASDIIGQCYRCDAGKKCCTVGWTKSCPKCPAGGADPKSYTSIFALETATPSSCFATGPALCAPKINITVDATCTISLDNRDYNNNPDDNTYCSWSTTTPVKGAKLSIADIAKFDYYPDSSLLSGNFTAAASPYLTVSIPQTKCTFRYRALTAPFAKLLGAAPKPSKATSCPAGQYLEANTDTKPGPCLRCPPGTYSPRASSSHKCLRCPAGTYTNRYGSTLCKRCPAGRMSTPGSASCTTCDSDTYPLPTGKGCKSCPKDSDLTTGPADRCLGNAYGSVCCAGGNCAGQPICKGPRKPTDTNDDGDSYTAILQLVSKSVAQPSCKNATFLSCLPVNGKLQISSSSVSPTSLYMEAYRTKYTCAKYTNYYYGYYRGATTAYVSAYEDVAGDTVYYGLKSDSSKGTITMYLATDSYDKTGAPTKASATCSATFKVISGYAFDLSPPKDAKCDPADAVLTFGGRKFCKACPYGQYRNSAGLCSDCPAGTFSDTAGAASCKPCRAGYYCVAGSDVESPCGYGTYTSKPGQAECAKCPKNTFGPAAWNPVTTKCTACPKGTIAPEAATGCGVPWDKKFPA